MPYSISKDSNAFNISTTVFTKMLKNAVVKRFLVGFFVRKLPAYYVITCTSLLKSWKKRTQTKSNFVDSKQSKEI